MRFNNAVSLKIFGRMALFSDPLTKMGGEKYSYPVPTYQALKGILESVYWKPTFIWIIDSVRILKPIRTEAKGIRPLEYGGGNTLANYTYLTDVEYQVKAHFEWNMLRPELADDRNEHKHYYIAQRMIERGGRRDVFLGTRECQAYVEPCHFGAGPGVYDNMEELTFGLMLHGLNYPDEAAVEEFQVRLWQPVMRCGVIDFCRPDQCSLVRSLKKQEIRHFMPDKDFSYCDDLFEQLGGGL